MAPHPASDCTCMPYVHQCIHDPTLLVLIRIVCPLSYWQEAEKKKTKAGKRLESGAVSCTYLQQGLHLAIATSGSLVHHFQSGFDLGLGRSGFNPGSYPGSTFA